METIEINGKKYQLDVEKAKELGLLKDTKPLSWEEYCNNSGKAIYTYDEFSSREESMAFIAFGKLIQLRDAWIEDWKPDWNDSNKHKWCIINDIDGLVIGLYGNTSRSLSFPTEWMANNFLETFYNLLIQAKMFL